MFCDNNHQEHDDEPLVVMIALTLPVVNDRWSGTFNGSRPRRHHIIIIIIIVITINSIKQHTLWSTSSTNSAKTNLPLPDTQEGNSASSTVVQKSSWPQAGLKLGYRNINLAPLGYEKF